MPHLQASVSETAAPHQLCRRRLDTLAQHLLTAGPSSTPALMTTTTEGMKTPNRATLTPTTQLGATP